jgi:two-component system OmpR family response regulator
MQRKLERILYVEDEEDIRTVATMALESLGGYTVLACGSAAEAIAQAPAARADLILLDVMMPVTDGPATLAALRKIEQTAQTPAVFMTAKVQPADVTYLKGLGAIEVIPKPFDPMTLADQLAGIWSRLG